MHFRIGRFEPEISEELVLAIGSRGGEESFDLWWLRHCFGSGKIGGGERSRVWWFGVASGRKFWFLGFLEASRRGRRWRKEPGLVIWSGGAKKVPVFRHFRDCPAAAAAMLRSFVRPLERCFGRLGGGDGLMWHMDLKPHTSGEFSIAVVQANSSLEDQGQVLTSPSATFVGVYDGHGGPEASRFVSNRLFPHLDRFASEQGGVSAEVIKRAFDATEEEFTHLVKRSWPSRPQIASVGTCCLVGAITGDTLFVANLGDSRAVLGRQAMNRKAVVAERLSTDHNVAVEEVRRELTELHPDDKHIVIHTRGVWRIKGIIQVSRSIGDIYLKNPGFSRDPLFQQFVAPLPLKRAVITAEPSIRIHKLTPHDLFLVFASDGLWEQLSDEAVVDIVSNNPRAGIAKRLIHAALNEAARKQEMRYDDIKKIEKGGRRHIHDDITVIVIFLDRNRQGSHPEFRGSHYDCTDTPADISSSKSDESEEAVGRI